MSVAERCHLVGHHRKEVLWLTLAYEPSVDNWFIFCLYFRLSWLFWHKLDDDKKAIEHGKSACDLAMQLGDHKHYRLQVHDLVFISAVWLADILHQINGGDTEAGRHFQEAYDWLPFISARSEEIYVLQALIVVHLLSIPGHNDNKQLKHYGQWAKMGLDKIIYEVPIMLGLQNRLLVVEDNNLAAVDDSLDHIFDDGGTTRKILNFYLNRYNKVSMVHSPSIQMLIYSLSHF